MKTLFEKRPDLLKAVFCYLDQNDLYLDDLLLDEILGSQTIDNIISEIDLDDQFGNEQFTFEPTPYNFIRKFLKVVQTSDKDIVYDLGAGYGRVVFYGALTTKAKFKGVEIVPERVKLSNEIIKKYKIKNAKLYCANVLDFDFSDGTIFFLFNPFTYPTLRQVIERLKKLSIDKSIKIAVWGGIINDFFEDQHWLERIGVEELEGFPKTMTIYQSF